MNREVELAKKILENKGYKVSRKMKESYSPNTLEELIREYAPKLQYGGEALASIWDDIVQEYGDEDLANDVIEALENEDVYESKEVNEAGGYAWMVNHPSYDPIGAPAISEEDRKKSEEDAVARERAFLDKRRKEEKAPEDYEYNSVLNKFVKYNDDHTNFEIWNESIEESDDLKYVGNTNGYSTYRKIENGKGVWFAKRQDDSDDKMFPISYDQARGFKEMPDETEIEKLQRKMGKMLLPQNESVDDRQQRRIIRDIANEVIQSRGENNSIGTYDAFIRKMIDNWATSGQDRDFIKAAIEKLFDKEFRVKESQVITISKPDDLVGHNPKFRVTYSSAPGETTSMTIEATDERAVEAIISGRFKRRGKNPPKFLSIERVSDIKESSEAPHTESYKGYSIQSYDDFGATIYKNGKKIREFENVDDAREYIDGLNESMNPLQKAILKSIKRLHESSGLDYDEMQYWNPIAIGSKVADYLGTDATQEEIESEISKILDRSDSKFQRAVDEALHQIEIDKESMSYDPMQGNKYHIGGSTPNVTETGTDYDIHDGGYTDDPELAIIKWLRLSKNSPMSISIDTNKNAHAQELLQWVVDNEEKFRKLCTEYNCPYKIDYMIDGCKKKLERPSNFETKYNYPDQIYPFAIG